MKCFGGSGAYRPNGVWTADFKGPFRFGVLCYTLTVADACSRRHPGPSGSAGHGGQAHTPGVRGKRSEKTGFRT